jgi:thermostable 8-oxoguanine DNA glycosylase
VLARRACGEPPRHRLGRTLSEEVGACLLGGHGIPASVGLAAFRQLQRRDVFKSVPTEAELLDLLREPLLVDGRSVHYRFARQKARYLAHALRILSEQAAPLETGRRLRDWLLQMPGVGYKTASWVARNWLDADDVAILDIHLLRAGALGGFFDPSLSVPRDYLELEAQFLMFSHAIGVRSSELDAIIWYEMMASPSTVGRLMDRELFRPAQRRWAHAPSADVRRPNPMQATLLDETAAPRLARNPKQ